MEYIWLVLIPRIFRCQLLEMFINEGSLLGEPSAVYSPFLFPEKQRLLLHPSLGNGPPICEVRNYELA